MINRVIWIILDSVGMEIPDADRFGDVGSNTIGNVSKVGGLNIPNLIKLGLGNIEGMRVTQIRKSFGLLWTIWRNI